MPALSVPRRTLRIAPAKQPREEPEPEFLLAPVSTGHWSNGIAVPQTLYEAQAVRGQRTYSYVWPKYFLDGKGIGVNLACALKGSPGNAMPKEELDALSSLAGCTLYFHWKGYQPRRFDIGLIAPTTTKRMLQIVAQQVQQSLQSDETPEDDDKFWHKPPVVQLRAISLIGLICVDEDVLELTYRHTFLMRKRI